MKTTNIKEKSFWGIWCMLTRNHMPITTCGLGWHMIFTILTFPFWVFPGVIFNGIVKLFSKDENILAYYYYIVINFIVLLIGAMGYRDNITDVSFARIYFAGFLTAIILICAMIVIVLIIVALVYCFEAVKDMIIEKASKKPIEEKVFPRLYYSLKDKHCSKINWF